MSTWKPSTRNTSPPAGPCWWASTSTLPLWWITPARWSWRPAPAHQHQPPPQVPGEGEGEVLLQLLSQPAWRASTGRISQLEQQILHKTLNLNNVNNSFEAQPQNAILCEALLCEGGQSVTMSQTCQSHMTRCSRHGPPLRTDYLEISLQTNNILFLCSIQAMLMTVSMIL